jgi:hypothetical protein
LIKWQRKQIKNQKKKGQTEKNIIIIEKNHKFVLKDKIKNYKNFDKRVKEKKRMWLRSQETNKIYKPSEKQILKE